MNNAETELTRVVRERLEDLGCHFTKLSDRFTRGVLDAIIVSDRVVWAEFKVFTTPGVIATYQQLGMSGAQDHHCRQTARRARRGSCCITGTADGRKISVWTPVSPESEQTPEYRLAAGPDGDSAYIWLCGALWPG